MFDTEYKLPEFVTEHGWQIHMMRSHFKQVAIGAANSGLDSFHLQWEAQRCNGDDRCGSPARIYYNSGWQARFSRGYRAPAPDIFVALYSDCRSEWMCDGEEATVWVANGERLFALVLEIEYDSFGREKNKWGQDPFFGRPTPLVAYPSPSDFDTCTLLARCVVSVPWGIHAMR